MEQTRHFYIEKFAFPDGEARLYSVDWTPPYVAGEEFDLHLNNGRFWNVHEGNLTYRSEGLTHKVPHPWLDISESLLKDEGWKMER